jgi:T4-like virus Myoviridae tail sheath stabiliser
MAIQQGEYYYNGQIRSYILQFMAIFTGLQVMVGKSDTQDERLIGVPIMYGHRDRIVAAIIAENTQNKPIRLPTMSAYMRTIDMAENMYAGVGVERRQTYVPVGGLVPDDMKVIYQRRALPFRVSMELAIMSSNTNQHFQILEQILPLFDPALNIQASDSIFDMTRLTSVKLVGINTDSNYPTGTENRIIQTTLTFEMIIYLDTPADVRKNVVEKIFMRIGAVASNASFDSNYEIIADLDAQGIDYTEVFNASEDLDFE